MHKHNAAKHLGHDDWRPPSVKELQSLVDYARSPETTHSAAIDPIFNCTTITNTAGQLDFPYYWSGTTHAGQNRADAAMYVAFGRAEGWMSSRGTGGGPPTDPGNGVRPEGLGQTGAQAEAGIDLAQEQRAAVAGKVAAGKIGDDLAAAQV